MAVPKKRHSHSRTRKRRNHQALKAEGHITCPQCREPMKLHHVCGNCGYYRSREVVAKEA
ncbi:MAG: 50S ribosomal protein L32 [Deltaproteobacteria bacterium]|nr:50S ribosomal protein L32 [Deltaproteobacteria bacterium]